MAQKCALRDVGRIIESVYVKTIWSTNRKQSASRTVDSALAAATKSKDQVKCCATLELVILSSLVVGPGVINQPLSHGKRGVDVHLLAAVDQTLLCRGDTLLLLDALLYPRDLLLISYTVFAWLLQVFCIGRTRNVRRERGVETAAVEGGVPCSRLRCRARSPCQ